MDRDRLEARAQPGTTMSASEAVDARRTFILIVDDNADTRLALTALFGIRGQPTASVGNGAEALAYLRADGGDTALVLLDLHMPDLDGRSFLRLKAQDPAIRDIPVVVYSAVDGDELPDDVAFVRKGSGTVEELLRAIDRALRRAAALRARAS